MIPRRSVVLFGPLALLGLASCERSRTQGVEARTQIEPSEAVDPAFAGCNKACGSKAGKDRREARAQPGAKPGDAAFCLVSGAPFRITDDSPARESRGMRLYFCCQACAAWFSEHEAEVLAKRGLG